jgi:thymidylate synthase (FAD)
MKVKLLTKTQNMLDVVYTGARTCYNAGSPIDMWFDVCNIPTDKKKTMLSKVFESGHLSTSEHAYFTFAIEGISRACSHQLVRHRHCSFSQQSQRYVEITEDQDELYEAFNEDYDSNNFKDSKIFKILDKYFVDADKFRNANGYYYALDNYLEVIKNGEKAEDARRFLPNATKTNIVVSMNLRELIHLCNERLCTRAQKEIRQLTNLMVKEVLKDEEWLKPYLVPKCEKNGFCSEHKSCGRKPTLNELKG